MLNRVEYPVIKIIATILIFLGVYLVSSKNAFSKGGLKNETAESDVTNEINPGSKN